jgi:hypothetical protein
LNRRDLDIFRITPKAPSQIPLLGADGGRPHPPFRDERSFGCAYKPWAQDRHRRRAGLFLEVSLEQRGLRQDMKRTRSQKVVDKIISKNDLRTIWSLLRKIALIDKAQTEKEQEEIPLQFRSAPSVPKIVVVSAGAIRTEDDTDQIFDNDVIDLRKTISVDFSYYNSQSSKSVTISFKEGDDRLFSESSFSISGGDPRWVDATFAEIETALEATKPQSNVFRKWRPLLSAILAVFIGYSFGKIIILLSPRESGPSPRLIQFAETHPPLLYLIAIGVFYLMGILPALGVTSWVGELWPSIEFDFGPEHLRQKKQLRGRSAAIVTLFLLPVLIDVIERFGFGWH